MKFGPQGYTRLFLLLSGLLLVTLAWLARSHGGRELELGPLTIDLGRLLTWALPVVLYLYASAFFFFLARCYQDPYQVACERLKEEAEGPPVKIPTPQVCMLVAVHNERRYIVDCVKSMLAQTYGARQIWVVNDASTDGTRERLEKEFAANPEVHLIHLEQNVGKKAALARALVQAKGDIFAFTDSDSVWESTAIERVVTIFGQHPEVGAVSGHTNARNATTNALTSLQDGWNQKQYRLRKGFESLFGSVSCVSGPLACYRRAAIYNYIPAWVDDTFLGQRFRFATDRTLTGFTLGGARLGPQLKSRYRDSPFVTGEDHPCRDYQVLYCESARALTNVAETKHQMLTQRVRWGKSFLRNLFLTGRFYYHQPLLPALYYYLHVVHVFLWPLLLTLLPIVLYLGGFWYLSLTYLSLLALLLALAGPVSRQTHPRFIRWFGRPLLNLYGLLLLPYLLLFSALTIKQMTWQRDSGGRTA